MTKNRVSLNGKLSEWAHVQSRVPQGSVLGPLLFLAFMNDLDDGIISKLSKFADDTKLGGGVGTVDGVQKLRQELKQLFRWAAEWQMLFNVEKCVVMHFGKSNKGYEYEMDGTKLRSTTVIPSSLNSVYCQMEQGFG